MPRPHRAPSPREAVFNYHESINRISVRTPFRNRAETPGGRRNQIPSSLRRRDLTFPYLFPFRLETSPCLVSSLSLENTAHVRDIRKRSSGSLEYSAPPA